MNLQRKYRVVLTGGGSGGHVMPLVAVAQSLHQKLDGNVEFLYIGSKGKIEIDAMAQANISMKFVATGKMRRYIAFQNVIDFFKVPVGFIQSLWHLLWFMPDAVFSKGGYVSVPVVVASRIYGIPVLTQDSDAVPGMATRVIGKFANRVALAYPSAMKYFLSGKAALVGNPVRSGVLNGDAERARNKFGLDVSKPVVLVLGGSLGARAIDMSVVKVLPKLLQKVQVIQQTGDAHYNDTVKIAQELGVAVNSNSGYYIAAYFQDEDLADALAVADLVVSRAGANAIAEIASAKKPAILIPLSTAANDEQRMNAYEIARIGGALVLEDANLGENMLFDKITGLLQDETLRQNMSKSIQVFYHPEADDVLADELIRLMQ